MKHRLVFCMILVFLVGGFAATVFADDILPPCWRGELGTTSQIWEFLTPSNPTHPDGPAPGGQPWLPSTIALIEPGPGMQWLPTFEGREGVWPLSGKIDVTVDNFNTNPDNEKWIWLQLTWRPQELGAVPSIFAQADQSPEIGPLQPFFSIPMSDGWMFSAYEWNFPFNPPDEFITISGQINVDELVIDTWCVPEPSTFTMLIIGAMGLAFMAWRRR